MKMNTIQTLSLFCGFWWSSISRKPFYCFLCFLLQSFGSARGERLENFSSSATKVLQHVLLTEGKSQFSEAISEVGVETSPKGQIMEIPNLKHFSFLDLNSATKNFKSDTLFGEGGFGKVYKGGCYQEIEPQKHARI